jgi:ribosomal protein S18 acetylase RimI-like enzyme
LVRPLRNGDTATVLALFQRLDGESRRRRFNGVKLRLSEYELEQLALVDRDHHTLVGYLPGDRQPVALARLVRDGDRAEIAFEVATAYQRRGIGVALAELLLADARAAGVRHVEALVAADNQPALALLRRLLGVLDISLEGPELWIRAAVTRPAPAIAGG